MRKLFIVFTDGSKITYTIKKSVDWKPYWDRHKNSFHIASAILQQYPKKDNDPIVLV